MQNLPTQKKKNFPRMFCRVGSDSSRFLGILRDADEEVDEETIKAGKIPPKKELWGQSNAGMNSGNWGRSTWILGGLDPLDSSPARITEGRARHGGGSSQGCRQPGKSHLPSEIREWRVLCPPKFESSSGPAALSKGRRPRTGIWPGFVAG